MLRLVRRRCEARWELPLAGFVDHRLGDSGT